MNEQKSALILPFVPRTLTGSGDPPGTGNWLGRMVAGTRFFAKRKNVVGSEVDDFVVYTDPSTMPVVLLAKNTQSRDGELCWHDPIVFSKNYTYYMTLEVLEPKNGNSNKIPTGPVVSDAKSKVITQLHEDE